MLFSRFLQTPLRRTNSKVSNRYVNWEGLRIYKEIYGDLRIPSKYVVGSEADDVAKWPSKFIGLKLGNHVNKVRVSLKKNLVSSKTAKELDSIGFIRDAYQDRKDRVVAAFAMYKDKFGNADVLQAFEIRESDVSWPKEARGLHLGTILSTVRRSGPSDLKETLRSMGFRVDNAITPPDFERNFAALQVYKKIHGHVKVPAKFVIPLDDERFAEEARGINLGAWLSNIRNVDSYQEYRRRLIDIGVVFKPSDLKISYNDIVDTVNAFKSVYGHTDVDVSFVVPVDDVRFPEAMWGVGLIPKIKEMRLWVKMQRLHGVVEVTSLAKDEVNFEVLDMYKSIYGDLKVSWSFIIGSDEKSDAWSKNMWGFSLGAHVHSIRSQLKHNLLPIDVVQKLESMGFISDAIKGREKSVILAFKTFIDKHGHGRVPARFKIGENDMSYPEETRGIALGMTLSNIRQGKFSSIKETLRSMGVEVDHVSTSRGFERNFAALSVYKKIHGHMKVPQRYVIPLDDERFAEEARGIKLGSWLNSVRLKGCFREHRQRLIDMGVSYVSRVIPPGDGVH